MKSVECPPRPKLEIVIDNGIFEPIVRLLVKLGLCHQKERFQAEHPNANVSEKLLGGW